MRLESRQTSGYPPHGRELLPKRFLQKWTKIITA